MDVQQVVARWDAEEKAVRVRLRDADAAPQEQIAGRTDGEFDTRRPIHEY